jgi:hypothetical protein
MDLVPKCTTTSFYPTMATNTRSVITKLLAIVTCACISRAIHHLMFTGIRERISICHGQITNRLTLEIPTRVPGCLAKTQVSTGLQSKLKHQTTAIFLKMQLQNTRLNKRFKLLRKERFWCFHRSLFFIITEMLNDSRYSLNSVSSNFAML